MLGLDTGKNLPITRIVNPGSHCFSSQWKSFSTIVFQYPIRYTILHVVCTSTWSLAPFIQHFHSNCTMDDLKNPTEIQLFILQDKLQLLGMVQFSWILFIVKILGITQHIYNVTLK